ncbi:hypothetical protein ASJ30_09640 [Janibacter indicus]|uniref:Uncharacterized protein n=1 Tax=Janibacter indicus TaxID=857417 RepID=A0A1L3MH81_9MICO|nr:hypothetical protein [Janibacter indicus]APH01755.1 hypothetical protein ASJ30_09640 [Janibacter indicus]
MLTHLDGPAAAGGEHRREQERRDDHADAEGAEHRDQRNGPDRGQHAHDDDQSHEEQRHESEEDRDGAGGRGHRVARPDLAEVLGSEAQPGVEVRRRAGGTVEADEAAGHQAPRQAR